MRTNLSIFQMVIKTMRSIFQRVIASAILVAATCSCTLKPILSNEKSTQTKVAPAPQDSKAYQNALSQAFADLKQEQAERSPAANHNGGGGLRNGLLPDLEHYSSFEVSVFPKLISFPGQRSGSSTTVHLAGVEKFRFTVSPQGHCGSAGALVPVAEQAQCVQLEIRPVLSSFHGKQVVRIFLSPAYRAYGLSYHEYDPAHDLVTAERKKVKWDPNEPLSSEMLALAKEIFPLDLPLYASNGLVQKDAQLKLQEQAPLLRPQSLANARMQQSCSGKSLRYKNAYGSLVTAGWCKGDPWPAVVETDRYLAILMSPMVKRR